MLDLLYNELHKTDLLGQFWKLASFNKQSINLKSDLPLGFGYQIAHADENGNGCHLLRLHHNQAPAKQLESRQE